MTKRNSKRIEALVEELHSLRVGVEPLLDVASSEARDEWRIFLQRLPASADLAAGFMSPSEAELQEMRSKAARFAAILRATHDRTSAPARDSERSTR